MRNKPTNLIDHIKTDHFRKLSTVIDMSNAWLKANCKKNIIGLVTTEALMNRQA